MQVEANRGPIEELDVQALAVAVFKNEKSDDGFIKKLDELSGGLVSSALEAEEFSGKEGETCYFHLVGNDKLKARRLMLVGAGEAEAFRQIIHQLFIGVADARVQGCNITPFTRGITRLFQQLALRALQRVFPKINFACRKFIKIPMQGVAVLTLHHQVAVVEQRYDHHRPRMPDVFPHRYFAVWETGVICTDVQKFPVIHIPAADCGFSKV